MAKQPVAADIGAELERLKERTGYILELAKKNGASAAEVGVSFGTGLSCTVRMGKTETVEFNRDQAIGVSVYFGQRKGASSTTDSSAEAIQSCVDAACDIAKYTSEDACAGLAEAKLMPAEIPDLDLYHPWSVSPEDALAFALEAEEQGLAYSSQIINSEGANFHSYQGCRVYGNSHGFIQGYSSSRYGAHCVLIAKGQEDMQRDYWYTAGCCEGDLEPMAVVGETAAQRTLARLNPQKVPTGVVPVLFSAEVATELAGHLLSAIAGGSLYRKASFLVDKLGQALFPAWVHIHEKPRLKARLGSVAFDQDGLATYDKSFIEAGVLRHYALSTYAARKLKLRSTANAGGVHNLMVDSHGGDQQALLKSMDSGLLVTELMGQGINLVTGDYSRGATGFWVENGEIQYPVAEITIAGNLKDMFGNLQAVGSDVDRRGNILTGSWLLEKMTVAGH